jgi:hypothetical protein
MKALTPIPHSPVHKLDIHHVSYTEEIGELDQEGRNIFLFFLSAYWKNKRSIKHTYIYNYSNFYHYIDYLYIKL